MSKAQTRRTCLLTMLLAAGLAPGAALSLPPTELGVFRLNRAPEQGGLSLGWAPAGARAITLDGQAVEIAPDGRFLVAFGRDYGETAVLTATLADGRAVSERLAVRRRVWEIENLPTVPPLPEPDAEFKARRPAELARIDAARSLTIASDGWRQAFIWPARGRISGHFGSQRIYAGQPGTPHSGVDVAGPVGAPVVAPADGVVTLAAAAPFTLEGHLLLIGHGMGLDSAFLHLSKIYVKEGETVRQGQVIGAIGMTGRASGPHLHWGMKWKDQRIDPQPLAGPVPP